MKHVTVRQALQRVADYPVRLDDDLIDAPCHELIARSLFDIANSPSTQRGAMTKANKARKMLMDRLGGRRRPGSHPATRTHAPIQFRDLTGNQLQEGQDDAPDDE